MASATPNYAVFAIPAYYVLCLAPHAYSTSLLKPSAALKKNDDVKTKQPKMLYNLANPRSVDNTAKYSSAIEKATFHKWERARAVHANMLETAPFVIGAVLIGIVTKLPADYMNKVCLGYFATRVLYFISYVAAASGPLVLGRTLWWAVGNAILGAIFLKAGTKVLNGEI